MACDSRQVFLTALRSGIVEEDEEEQDEEAAEDEGKDACEHGMERWFKGPAYDSDDYDTDLEDDFPPGRYHVFIKNSLQCCILKLLCYVVSLCSSLYSTLLTPPPPTIIEKRGYIQLLKHFCDVLSKVSIWYRMP